MPRRTTLRAWDLRQLHQRQWAWRHKIWWHLDFGDGRYIPIRRTKVEEYVSRARVYEREYLPHVYDCEDFARSLAARVYEFAADDGVRHPYAFGTIWGMFNGARHAVNWYVNRNWQIYLVEPQQRAAIWSPTSEDRGIWKIEG